ncbi:MAG TPA: hypothetical protein GXX33_06845 [Firmicutes bacterium]|uniref:Uncharacterized protein n=1 Tax=Capillibacterium thermochitinicola TaxID=2699427 RepID=A0A8J6I0F9_9FIRM|nr:hypothetical protein [Capillibacterium thermochitinicola]HHW12701.1 hypothetical protein [Bacillota bacterium]
MDRSYDRPFKPDTRYLDCKTDSVLSCGQGIDGLARPVQVDTEGAVSVLPNAAVYAQAGRLFSVTDSIVLPTGGPFIALTFENPATNGQVMYLEQVAAGIFVNEVTGERVGNEQTIDLLVAQIPQVRDVDETLTPVNNLSGSPRTSTLLVRTVDDFDLGPVHFSNIYPSGEIEQNFRGRIILPPGHILLVLIVNRASNITNALLAVTITWWELPLTPKKRKRKRTREEAGEEAKKEQE